MQVTWGRAGQGTEGGTRPEGRTRQGGEQPCKSRNLDFPPWAGVGGEMWLELKFGISAGKESRGVLGRRDERVREMEGGALTHSPPFQVPTAEGA